MKARSLSTFRTKLRQDDEKTVLVNIGDVIEADAEHLRALARNRLVEIIDGDEQDKPAKIKAEPKSESKPKGGAKPGPVAKATKPKGARVSGRTVSAPAAGKGEGVLMPPAGGGESLPPVKNAEGGDGAE